VKKIKGTVLFFKQAKKQMSNFARLFFFLIFLLLLWTTDYGLLTKCGMTDYAYAEIPHLINYQGRLTDKEGKPVTDGTYQIIFRIFDAATAGNLLWEETHSSVLIQKGIFSILLGSVTNLNLAFDKPYYLEIKVGNEVMNPRQQIASAAYAIRAEKACLAESAEKASILNIPARQGDILYYNGTSWVSLAKGTEGQYLRMGADSPTWATITTYTAGNNCIAVDDVEHRCAGSTYEKVSEFRINGSGTLRIKFDLRGSGNQGMCGKIYRNGKAIGKEMCCEIGAPWTTFSEDISGWVAGDLVQLYIHDWNNTGMESKNFRICTNGL
jgi:hypothetical protein